MRKKKGQSDRAARLFLISESLFGHSSSALPVLQSTFSPICLGVALAHLMHMPASFQFFRPLFGWQMLSWITLLLIAIICAAYTDIQGAPRLALHLLLFTLIGVLLYNPTHLLTRFLELPFISRIGLVRYGMYLYHFPVIHVLSKFMQTPLLLCPATLMLTYLVAEVSYRTIETYFLGRKGIL